MTDFVNMHVVIEPVERGEVETTKFKNEDGSPKVAAYWSCIVWTVENETLVPHSGVNVFTAVVRQALDVAYRAGAPIAGRLVVGRGQYKYELVPGDPATMALLEQLWEQQPHFPLPDISSLGTDELF
jgi:hypothetical protein